MIAMTEKPTRTPYDAEHVAIVDNGHTVWALYIPNPEQAKDPRAVVNNIASRCYSDVEVIAQARRFYKRNGSSFSGWIVESGLDYSDPIPTKPEAMGTLNDAIRDYFNRRG